MGKIVITGASSEIGLAITELLAELHKPMILQCSKNIQSLSKWNDRATVIKADFGNEAQLDDFISQLSDVEILIYAAARTDTGLIPQIELKALKESIQVNIIAYTRICQAVIPQMCIKRNGVIIGISSVTATKVYRGQGVYSGTKAYMEAFTKSITAEYGRKGIRSNCVAPGSINAGTLKKLGEVITTDQIRQLNASGQLGNPADVARVVNYLCQPETTFINGSVIHLDGGHWLGI